MQASGKRWSGRKLVLAVLASVGILAIVGVTVGSMVMPFLAGPPDDAARPVTSAPSATAPAVVGMPLAVRTVVDEPTVATVDDCPPTPPPVTPQESLRLCDVEKAAVYPLGPIAVQLNLTGATSARLPASEFHTVQMRLDAASRTAFAQYTAANIGKRVAFVRDGVVLAAPTISQPVDGQSLQIMGELTAAAADTIVRMLRDGS